MEDIQLVMILFIVLPIALGSLVRSTALKKRVDRLEEEMTRLRKALVRALEQSAADRPERPDVTPSAATPTHGTTPEAAPSTPAPASGRRPELPPTQGTKRPVSAARQREDALRNSPRNRPSPPPEPARSNAEWEELLGGKVLNRIGALALVIGIAFFLKYAFDRDWISEWMRVAIGGLSGVALLVGGMRFHRRGLAVFAQGLIGAGIAVLYLSVYASFNFYHIVPQVPAFFLMSAVTAVAFFQGRRYDSLAVALLGWIGGFITPLLLSTGTVNPTGLFTYLALLDVGMGAMLIRQRKWSVLEPLSLIASYLWFIAWFLDWYTKPQFAVAVGFISLFWLLFHLADVGRAFAPEGTKSMLREFFAALNSTLHALFVYIAVSETYPDWSGTALFIVAALHLGTVLLTARAPLVSPAAWKRYCATATIAIALAIAAQFHGFTIVVLWSALALLLMRIGAARRAKHLHTSGMLLFVAALLLLAGLPETVGSSAAAAADGLFALRRIFTFAALTAVAIVGARLSGSMSRRLSREALLYIAVALPFAFITIQLHDSLQPTPTTPESPGGYSEYIEILSFGIAWALYSLPVVWLGLRYKIRALVYGGLGALGAAVIVAATRGMTYESTIDFTLLLNYRVFALIVVVLAAALQIRMTGDQRSPLAGAEWLRTTLRAMIVLLIFGLITVETNEYYARRLDLVPHTDDMLEYAATLRNTHQLVLSGLWVLYSTLLMVIGFLRRSRSLRVIAFALFGLSILKIFLYDLSFLGTLYRIFSFIGLGLILLLISYLFQRYKDLLFGIEANATPPRTTEESTGPHTETEGG